MQSVLPKAIVDALNRQKYQLVGFHSAIKKCRWLHQSLVNDRFCYKSKFYGISSHRCLQMTPTVAWCNMRCNFCWRIQPDDLDISWNELESGIWDPPEGIVESSIKAQRKLLSGYKSQVKNGKIELKKFNEALNPIHVAISLSGEPTIYPGIGGLLYEFQKRGLTSFLVTNGACPEALEKLSEEPSQIYVSLCAPNEKSFIKICQPIIPNAWQNLMKSLSLLQSFKCPSAIRMTLVKGVNMNNLKEYSRIIRETSPTYVEAKAFMSVGYSRRRLGLNHMPSLKEIRDFSRSLSEMTSYRIVNESIDSRVILLTKLEKPLQILSNI